MTIPDAFHDAFDDLELSGLPTLPVTIDTQTMEVLADEMSPLTFRDLREAEASLEKLAGRENSIRLVRARTLIAIRDQQLYKEAFDSETGEPIKTFDAYLKDVCKRMVAFDGAMPRSTKDWMLKVRIYDEQLGMGDVEILRLGHHGTLMLQAAARNSRSGELMDEDEDLNNGGGKRLGHSAFKHFVEDISQKVFKAQDDKSLVWTTKETEAAVNAIINKHVNQFSIEVRASFLGSDKVEIKGITLWIEEVPVNIGDKIAITDARMIPTSVQVEGLGDNWR